MAIVISFSLDRTFSCYSVHAVSRLNLLWIDENISTVKRLLFARTIMNHKRGSSYLPLFSSQLWDLKSHIWRHSTVLVPDCFHGMTCYRSMTLPEVMEIWSIWNLFFSRDTQRWSWISQIHSSKSCLSMKKWRVIKARHYLN